MHQQHISGVEYDINQVLNINIDPSHRLWTL